MAAVARSHVFSAALGPAHHRTDGLNGRVKSETSRHSAGGDLVGSAANKSSDRFKLLQATKREATMLLAGKDLVSPPSALSIADSEKFGNVTFNPPSEEGKKLLQEGATVYAELNYTLAAENKQGEFTDQYQQIADFGKKQPGYLDITLFKVGNVLIGSPPQYFTFAKWATYEQFQAFFASTQLNDFKTYLQTNNIALDVKILLPRRDVQDCI